SWSGVKRFPSSTRWAETKQRGGHRGQLHPQGRDSSSTSRIVKVKLWTTRDNTMLMSHQFRRPYHPKDLGHRLSPNHTPWRTNLRSKILMPLRNVKWSR